MTKRIAITAGRIIVSKPGYEAGPSLNDEFKSFDSDWDFTGTLLASGVYIDPAPIYAGDVNSTTTSTPFTIVLNIAFNASDLYLYYEHDYYSETLAVRYVPPSGASYDVNRNNLILPYGTQVAQDNPWAFNSGNAILQRKSSGGIYGRMRNPMLYQVYAI